MQTTVTTKELAELLGLSTQRITQLRQEGVFEASGTPLQYDVTVSVRSYVDFMLDSARGRTAEDVDAEKKRLQADADFKRARADQEQIKLDELEGRMHSAEDVERAVGQLVHAVRSSLLALPGRVAVDAANAKSAPEVSALMQREVYAILDDLSNYEYDPKAYAAMVRERRGWVDAEGGSEEGEDEG